MVIETGRSVAEVARDLEIHNATLGNWVSAYLHACAEHDDLAQSAEESARVKEVEDEIRRLRTENELLKRTAAFLSRTPH